MNWDNATYRQIIAVVLNYNDAAATKRCVRSVLATSCISNVIIVDNGSDPRDRRSLEGLSKEVGARVRLRFSDVNGGFGYGMNLGIELALALGAERILLLNNDTIVESNALASLDAKFNAHADVGIAVPVVTMGQQPRTVWAAGGTFDERTFRVRHNCTGLSVLQATSQCLSAPLTFAPGAALLVRSEVFRKVGGFVEGFFLYFEDVEFSMRTRAAGFQIVLAPEAFVWHAVQGGSRTRSMASVYYRVRNALWLANRNLPKRLQPRAFFVISTTAVMVVLRKSQGRPSTVARGLMNVLRGLRDGLFRKPPEADLRPRPFT